MRIGSSIVLKGSGGEGGLGLGPGAPDPVPDPRPRASVAILDQPLILESIRAFERGELMDRTYTVEELLLPFGFVHIDAILVALEKRGLEKDSATKEHVLPARFRCDKKRMPTTGPFGIRFLDGHSIYFELKMAGGEADVELREYKGKASSIPTELGSWQYPVTAPQFVLQYVAEKEKVAKRRRQKKDKDAERRRKRRYAKKEKPRPSGGL